MPSAPGKFHSLPVNFTNAEWESLSAEAYSREISRAEMLRRALKHFCECQESAISEVVKPPRNWWPSRAENE